MGVTAEVVLQPLNLSDAAFDILSGNSLRVLWDWVCVDWCRLLSAIVYYSQCLYPSSVLR